MGLAGGCRSEDGFFAAPVEAYQEGCSLAEIGEAQIEEEQDVLIVADESRVVVFPSDEAVGDKAQ